MKLKLDYKVGAVFVCEESRASAGVIVFNISNFTPIQWQIVTISHCVRVSCDRVRVLPEIIVRD